MQDAETIRHFNGRRAPCPWLAQPFRVRKMDRLSQARLTSLSPTVSVPDYDRAAVAPGIVHIGIGAFHRAHMAVYIDALLAGDARWGIIGASLRRPDTKLALEPQDYLYSVTARDAGKSTSRIVGSILDVLDASADTSQLIRTISEPTIRIVSLTVTEKGYCHDPASGALMTDHPDIVHDLAHPTSPRSAPGIIVAALAMRRARAAGGLTVMSCDNLQGNGHIAGRVIVEFARLYDPSLAAWIADTVSFPCTMVDRIVPSTTDADRAAVEDLLGLCDAWPIVTEPFSQWIVEDKFAAGRPPLDTVGVQLVSDVEPYELMKLRLLNGSHSTMAYLGLLGGHETVSAAVSDPDIGRLVARLMADEVIPTLDVEGVDLNDYANRLVERFANPALQHRLAQIATDGSQKLPQRVLMPIRERRARQQSVRLLSLTVAGWIAYVAATVRSTPEALADPLAPRLTEAVLASDGSAGDLVRRFFAIGDIFGDDLAQDGELLAGIKDSLERILGHNVASAIAHVLE